MGFSINDLGLAFSQVFGKHDLVLKSVKPWREFEGDKRQLGFSYALNIPDLCCKITVKTHGSTPVISNDEVMKSDTPIYVSVVANYMSFYGKSVYDADVSVVADSISIKPATKTARPEGFPTDSKPK